MNPFLLPGPPFLAFYLAGAVVVILVLWVGLRFSGGDARLRLTELTSDPYRIACLRKGEAEAIRIALFNLVDRGLLTLSDEFVQAARGDSAEIVRRPLDRAILAECRLPVRVSEILRSSRVVPEAARYRAEMANKGLLHPRSTSWTAILAGCALLGGVAVTKIAMAWFQGRHNVAALAILALVACFTVVATLSFARTRAGNDMLAQLRSMTRRLKLRAPHLKEGGETNEALLLAAVFGLSALPRDKFWFIENLFPKPKTDSGGTDGGSSCGSSSDSGCGGGGGCGGCGG